MSGPEDDRGAVGGGRRQDRAASALLKRFQAEEQLAIDTVAQWIGHPSVRPVIERRQGTAEAAVWPIARHLTDQEQVARLCWRVYGIAGVGTDWSIRRGAPWMLTPAEMSVIERVEADLRGTVELAIHELHCAGVGLDPAWAGDHAVVAELLLLALSIPWDLPPGELASNLNPPPIGAIHIDAGGTRHRRWAGEQAEGNITALRRGYEKHLHGPPPRAPYAGGGTRALPKSTRRRREALRQVLERWPDVRASQIYTTFGDHTLRRGAEAATPGGYLRQLLEKDIDPAETVKRPKKSTLHDDLRVLREDAGKKPSG